MVYSIWVIWVKIHNRAVDKGIHFCRKTTRDRGEYSRSREPLACQDLKAGEEGHQRSWDFVAFTVTLSGKISPPFHNLSGPTDWAQLEVRGQGGPLTQVSLPNTDTVWKGRAGLSSTLKMSTISCHFPELKISRSLCTMLRYESISVLPCCILNY